MAHKKDNPFWAVLVVLTLLTVLILLAIGFFRSLPFVDVQSISSQDVATRLLPIGHSVLGPAVSEDGTVAALTPEQIFNKTCIACHGSGVAGAPVFKNSEQWASRIANGLDALVQNAINGINAMPPRGGNASLTDDEVRKTVIYMANQSGANFEEK